MREAFDAYRGPFPSIDVLLTWGAARFEAVSVQHEPRRVGASNYTFQLASHAAQHDDRVQHPAAGNRQRGRAGLNVVRRLILVYVVGHFILFGGSVPGFSFLACTIAIFSGVQLFALGIMGEYLARMHFRLMERPAYAIRH